MLLAAFCLAVLLVLMVTFLTHVVAPRLFTHYEHFPALAGVPKRTLNAKRVLADPVNVALVGTDSEITAALRRAGWARADAISRARERRPARLDVPRHRARPARRRSQRRRRPVRHGW